MSDVVALKTKADLAPLSLSDPLAAYADAVDPRHIVGTILRFSKGDYLAGVAGDLVHVGTHFTLAVDELLAGHIKWFGGKPVEHIMVRVAEGGRLPKRSELGDTDPSAWETDINGKPRDPWQFTNYLPSLSEKDELFTFATSSRGGISAIARLARRYAQHRKKHPDVYPVIALGVDSYQHPNREYGRIKVPEFTLVGYVPKTKFLAALEAAGLVTAEQPSPPIQPEPGDAFSDEVPF